LIIIGTTILAFFVAAFWVALREGMGRVFGQPDNHERLVTIRRLWKRKPEMV
jgi:hypothetical protein